MGHQLQGWRCDPLIAPRAARLRTACTRHDNCPTAAATVAAAQQRLCCVAIGPQATSPQHIGRTHAHAQAQEPAHAQTHAQAYAGVCGRCGEAGGGGATSVCSLPQSGGLDAAPSCTSRYASGAAQRDGDGGCGGHDGGGVGGGSSGLSNARRGFQSPHPSSAAGFRRISALPPAVPIAVTTRSSSTSSPMPLRHSSSVLSGATSPSLFPSVRPSPRRRGRGRVSVVTSALAPHTQAQWSVPIDAERTRHSEGILAKGWPAFPHLSSSPSLPPPPLSSTPSTSLPSKKSSWRKTRRTAAVAALSPRRPPLSSSSSPFDGAEWTYPPAVPTTRMPLPPNPAQPGKHVNRYKPAVVPIPDHFLSSLIPLSGSGPQVLQCLGGPLDWFRRLAVSLAVSVVCYNISTWLTIAAALYWAWSPMWSAALTNTALRIKYPYAGLWLARVVDVSVVQDDGHGGMGQPVLWRVRVGDHTGTSIEMVVEAPRTRFRLHRRDPIELIVVSDDPTFARFRALREVFLPRQGGGGVWLAEDAVVERSAFEELRRQLRYRPLNALAGDSSDDEDLDGLYSLMSEENSQNVGQYKYDNGSSSRSDGGGSSANMQWADGPSSAGMMGSAPASVPAPDPQVLLGLADSSAFGESWGGGSDLGGSIGGGSGGAGGGMGYDMGSMGLQSVFGDVREIELPERFRDLP